jgi:thiamine-monophosphate kinase
VDRGEDGVTSANTGGPSIGELGEFGLIAAMAQRLAPGPGTVVGIGDDAAVLAAPDGRVVATTDFLLEGRHFRRDWAGPADIGHRAAVRSLADVAAMGARPTALLVAFAAPPALSSAWALELSDGLAAEAARAGATVAGGDTARFDVVLLAVTGLGDLQGARPVTRAGARLGDVVAVAGPLGHSAAGLALLEAGYREPALLAAGHREAAALVTAHLRPAPPYDAGPEAARLGATALMDVSDGLLADLGHIARASGVAIDVHPATLDPSPLIPAAELLGPGAPQIPPTPPAPQTPPNPQAPRTPQASQTPQAPLTTPASQTALEWMLTGGEDHSLVAAFPAGTALPPRWRVVGEVRAGQGVLVDGHPHAGPGGWEHFH